MVTVGDIYNYIDTFAPFHTAMGFDNVGLLVGGKHCPVTSVMVSMDITPEVISEAVSQNAELIISHHPVIFQPLKRLSPTDVPYLLVQNGLCAIAAHTNYDLACGGVNACLAERLQLKQISMLEEYDNSEPPNVSATILYIAKVKDAKDLPAVKTAFEKRLSLIQQSFEQYLPDQYDLAKKGQVVTEGNYIMLAIAQDTDQAVEAFRNVLK